MMVKPPRVRLVPTSVAVLAAVLWMLLPVASASAATLVTVTPDTGLSGGQDVTVAASGFVPGDTAGWCEGVASPGPPDPSFCGANTTYTRVVDSNGEITGVFSLQRFIYVPALSRWVDCVDPAESCLVGAAEELDIVGTAAVAPLSFATPPDPPATRGTIRLDEVSGGVTVTGSGFRPGAEVDVHQCASGADHPSACGFAKAWTSTDASGGFQVTVTPDSTVTPAGGTTVDCLPLASQACSIVAAESVDFPGTVVGVPLPEPPPPVPVITPGVGSTVEGDAGSTTVDVPVVLSEPTTTTVTAQWTTLFAPGAPAGQADPTTDYTPVSGTVTFAPGETSQTATVTVSGDTDLEPDEYIVVSFHDPTDAKMGGFWGLGFGGITDDDQATLLPGVALVLEGNAGTATVEVPVALSEPVATTVTAQWTTLFVADAPAGQADPTTDYTPVSGTVTFAPGETSQTIAVTVDGDTDLEPDEYIVVSFRHPTDAKMGGFWGLGFGGITDDD
jgi:hypothetical protein